MLEVEKLVNERMNTLMKGLFEKHPAPDKEADQLVWVAHMNGLLAMAKESILQEIVYNANVALHKSLIND